MLFRFVPGCNKSRVTGTIHFVSIILAISLGLDAKILSKFHVREITSYAKDSLESAETISLQVYICLFADKMLRYKRGVLKL